jgi:hypothetical protein
MGRLLNLLQEPLLKNVDIDSEDLLTHGKILIFCYVFFSINYY